MQEIGIKKLAHINCRYREYVDYEALRTVPGYPLCFLTDSRRWHVFDWRECRRRQRLRVRRLTRLCGAVVAPAGRMPFRGRQGDLRRLLRRPETKRYQRQARISEGWTKRGRLSRVAHRFDSHSRRPMRGDAFN